MLKDEPPWSDREGLVSLGTVGQTDARMSLLRSVPRLTDAIRVTEGVRALLGDRLYADPAAGPGNHALYLRDDEDPRFVVADALVWLDVDFPAPTPIAFPRLPGSEDGDEAEGDPFVDAPPVLPGLHRCRGELRLAEGPAYVVIRYGPDGQREESAHNGGDLWAFAYRPDAPYQLDPRAKPPQTPPLGLYTRDDVDPSGHDVDTLATRIAALEPGRLSHGRVFVPAPSPGGVGGVWARGVAGLREALWDGRIGDESGWAVIDGWSAKVIAVGPTLDAAFAAWSARVREAQPLPPPAPPPVADDDVDEAPAAEREGGTARFSSGTIRLVGRPRPALPWPEPRPENVPAVAVRLPPPIAVPQPFAAIGFARAVRLIGAHGVASTAFVRDDGPDAWTLVGEGAAAAVDPPTLTAALDALEARRDADLRELLAWTGRAPPASFDHPWQLAIDDAWDVTGRAPRLRSRSVSYAADRPVRDVDGDAVRWGVARARRLS